mmetsp:Transcript_17796/g.41476  ORF Transcript_17796/g.41476 Transcript_17796/m.41476 type:complete len:595 (-) Transcript_17796:37-1821(-)
MIPDYSVGSVGSVPASPLSGVYTRRFSRVGLRAYRSGRSSEGSSDESDGGSLASRSDFGRSSMTDDVYDDGMVANLSDLVYLPEDLVYHPDQIQVTHERMQQVLDGLPGLSSDSEVGSASPVPHSQLAAHLQDYEIDSEISEAPAIFEESDSDGGISNLMSAARRGIQAEEDCEDEYDEVPKPPELPVVQQEQLQDVWPLGDESFNIFVCPITHDVMTDPVVCADGYTYERLAIARWFETSRMSPVTGQTLPHAELVPNHSVRTLLKTLIDMTDRARPSSAAAASVPEVATAAGPAEAADTVPAQTDKTAQSATEAGGAAAQSPDAGAATGRLGAASASLSAVNQSGMQRLEGGAPTSPGQLSESASMLASSGELTAESPERDQHADLAGRLRNIATERRGRSGASAADPGSSQSIVFGASGPRIPPEGHRRPLPGFSLHVAGELPHIDSVFSGPDRTTRRNPRSISSQMSSRLPRRPAEQLVGDASSREQQVESDASSSQSVRNRSDSPWGIRFAGGPSQPRHRPVTANAPSCRPTLPAPPLGPRPPTAPAASSLRSPVAANGQGLSAGSEASPSSSGSRPQYGACSISLPVA